MKSGPAGQLHSPEEALSSPEIVETAQRSLTLGIIKLAVMAALMMATIVIAHGASEGSPVMDLQQWKVRLAVAGSAGVVWFGGVAALAVALGFPRLLMTAAAGTLFGFKWGFPLAWLSAMAGAWLNFALVRWGARDFFRRRIKLPPRIEPLLRRPGLISVVILRQLPVWGGAVNASLALTGIRHRVFIAGTLAGTLPSALIVVLIGSGLGKSELSDSLRNLTWAFIVLGALSMAVWAWCRRRARRPSARVAGTTGETPP